MNGKVKAPKTFEKYLTVKEASQFIGVSETTIRNWDRNGRLSAFRHPVNNYRLYDPYELKQLLKGTSKNNVLNQSLKTSEKNQQRNPFKIVVVEDNMRDVELFNRALQKNNFTGPVTFLKDGQVALDYFNNFADEKKPTLIFLDLKIPKVHGVEVLRFVKTNKKTKRIPVIVLTTCDSGRDIEVCYELGVSGYILKSINFNRFYSSLGLCLKYWAEANQVPPFISEVT